MKNLQGFNFFLNEKKSYKDLSPNEVGMVSGIIEILRQVKDPKNREEMIEYSIAEEYQEQ